MRTRKEQRERKDHNEPTHIFVYSMRNSSRFLCTLTMVKISKMLHVPPLSHFSVSLTRFLFYLTAAWHTHTTTTIVGAQSARKLSKSSLICMQVCVCVCAYTCVYVCVCVSMWNTLLVVKVVEEEAAATTCPWGWIKGLHLWKLISFRFHATSPSLSLPSLHLVKERERAQPCMYV